MDQNHPIPQQISSYQFRLVGDMTLKQFFQIAGGALIGLIFYATPLHPLIKWPLIIFFGILGVALAFLPFEERPLEVWIVAFFRSIYSPTLFNWRKSELNPVFFQEQAPVPEEKIISPKGEEALKTYLASSTKAPGLEALEAAEKGFLEKIKSIFGSIPAPSFKTAAAPPKLVVEETSSFGPAKPLGPVPQPRFTPVSPLIGRPVAAQSAQFSPEAGPPVPPTVANTIVGQVVDDQGKIVEGAILEIRDIAGRPVRALKTNKLGHFIIVTPLTNGRYEIITEKDNFSFNPVWFEATGEIIPPIAIRGKAQAVPAAAPQPESPAAQVTL